MRASCQRTIISLRALIWHYPGSKIFLCADNGSSLEEDYLRLHNRENGWYRWCANKTKRSTQFTNREHLIACFKQHIIDISHDRNYTLVVGSDTRARTWLKWRISIESFSAWSFLYYANTLAKWMCRIHLVLFAQDLLVRVQHRELSQTLTRYRQTTQFI